MKVGHLITVLITYLLLASGQVVVNDRARRAEAALYECTLFVERMTEGTEVTP